MADSEEKSESTSESKSGATSKVTSEDNAEAKPAPKPEPKPAPKPEPKPAPKPEPKSEGNSGGKRRADPEKNGDKKAAASTTVNTVRGYVATAVWVLAVLAAVILAVGALMITLDFNQKNGLVDFFTSTADKIDFGLFKEFKPGKGETAADVATKNALVNWGIAAVIYLVGGKILERIIRP